MRVDNRGDTSQWTRNVRLDSAYVSGAASHAVETYGVDGLTAGSVTARNVGESGLLLNQTINATVGTVDAENAGTGTGYAAFRMANRNGRVGSSYPDNIRVGTVKPRGGGRGVFCVPGAAAPRPAAGRRRHRFRYAPAARRRCPDAVPHRENRAPPTRGHPARPGTPHPRHRAARRGAAYRATRRGADRRRHGSGCRPAAGRGGPPR
ncbi:hypothetical protein [Catenuloplanes indicus]|uniref:Uncharacterized protein n=1 Tax=Catenuloplanes indicus TaxID=137267 RepID=A0AAE3VX76_9ACTN|nr:hypothetical protein [Catenuloplanes indicus]MDQ0365381.1 hypothetical protein [Catenuloplanes indicus]